MSGRSRHASARERLRAAAVLGVLVLLHALAASLLAGAVQAEVPAAPTAATPSPPADQFATPTPTETPTFAETPASEESPTTTETPSGTPKPGKSKSAKNSGPAGMLAIGKDDEPVTVDADSLTYDREADALHAKGDVMVTTGGSVLAADQIDIDRKTGQANAAGQVVLEDPQGRLRAENATFFLEDETGWLEEGEVYMPQTRFQITGKKIEKGIGQSYHIWDGTLTTCGPAHRRLNPSDQT